MKKIFSSICILVLLALASCVGQEERLFPWEESCRDDNTTEVNHARKSLLLDFTATWCVNCPNMEASIKEAQKDTSISIVPVSVHYLDEMSCVASEELVKTFNITSYPSLIVDMDPESLTSITSSTLMRSVIQEHATKYHEPCKIDVTVNGDAGEFDIKAGFSFVAEGQYAAGAMLLEDGIISAQSGASDSYIHDNVLRKFLQDSIFGIPISVAPNMMEGSCTWHASIPPDGDSDNYGIVVYVVDTSSDMPIVINSSSKIAIL